MRLMGLGTGGLLYLTQVERAGREKVKEIASEAFGLGCYYTWEKEGVPTPPMTLDVQPPNLGDKKIYAEEMFDWIWPEGKRITLDDIGMDVEEALDGMLTNLDQDFPLDQKFTTDNIISTGIGLTTEQKQK